MSSDIQPGTDQSDQPDQTGLTFRTLDPSAHDTDGDRELLHGWGEALSRGFHEGRPTDEHRTVWLEGARADAVRLQGFWPDTTAVASPNLPVATFASWAGGDLNVGGGRTLPLHMITDVTVSPSHRRRGLLRSLMHRDLAAAAERGHALAGLTVTEGSIYGRFGFGLATRLRSLSIDVTSRFALRPFDDPGSLEIVEPSEVWESLKTIHAERVRSTRGALAWPAFYEAFLTGRFDWEQGAPDRKVRFVLHLDAAGRPDGFASWTHKGTQDGRSTVDVGDVAATTPTAYLALWQFLGGIDLTERVRWGRAPLVDPLEWALVDPRCVTTTKVDDLLWLRVLDVVAALEARPWYADGTVALGLEDPLGLIDGTWQVTVTEGRATVVRTDAHAEVILSAETLGALYLGGVDTPTLRSAGRLGGSNEALARWGALVDGGPAPYCTTGF
ncbi:GNAT family N-acetyltransferase [Nocardioides sp.]|uniref:GNAT family N-acetyltransferase n=1 Tax=Nocardioides sp. TaxID=35761 RepID=UPI002B271C43|nr:GNAT family N-acetyltransferase [Nocardioides sp.]